MKMRSVPFFLFTILFFLSIMQAFFFNSISPPVVASHFDIRGVPDSMVSKTSLLLFHIILVVSVSVLFFLSGVFLHKIPPQLLNLPKKDYWLDPVRRDKTYNIFSKYLFWFADITLIFFVAAFQKVYMFNLSGEKKIGDFFFYYLLAFLFAAGLFAAAFFKKFLKTDED